VKSTTVTLQQVAKLFFGESGISNDASHREGVHGVVSWIVHGLHGAERFPQD
jgi:hypothetical protein